MGHAVNSDDEKTRAEARLVVREALASVINRVVCSPKNDLGEEGRFLTLWVADNHLMIEFDNDGNVLTSWDLVGLTNSDEPIIAQMSAELMVDSRHGGKALEAVKRIAPPERFPQEA